MSLSQKGIRFILFCVQAPFDMVLWENIALDYVSENCSVVSNSATPGTVVHGILQAIILEWVAVAFSRGSSNPAIEPRSPELQADSVPSEPLGKPHLIIHIYIYIYSNYMLNKIYNQTYIIIYIILNLYVTIILFIFKI